MRFPREARREGSPRNAKSRYPRFSVTQGMTDDGSQMTDTGIVGTVREVFHLKERGRVLVLTWGDPDIRFKPGDAVEIRMPGGRIVTTRLTGVETHCGGDHSTFGVLLPKEMDATEIPPGAEVWKRT